MNKLAAMHTFVSIVDAGSLTAAAESLGKALPTVVRSLAILEEELGARLLRRTTRHMSLTQEGRIYFDRCRRILADIEEAEAALSSSQVEPRGELRVTAPVLFGQLKVAPLVIGFLKAYSQVNMELILLDRVVNMVEEGIDVGIRIAPLNDSSMIATRVGEVRRVAVASPSLLKRVGTPKHPRDLSGKPAVHFSRVLSEPNWEFVEDAKTLNVPVGGPLACNNAAAAVDACAAGLGFGQFLSYQVEAAVAQKRLRVVLAKFEQPPIPVNVVFSHARLMSPRIRAFVDWMKEHL